MRTMVTSSALSALLMAVSAVAALQPFPADFKTQVIDNKAFLAKGPLPIPVLAIGDEKSFGPMMATVARAAASNVQGAVIPDSGHWLMEEQPQATVSVILNFLR
jgi:pimeloyl-ACP methyl ester carboxylesterase